MVVGPDRPLVASVAYDLPVPRPRPAASAARGFALATDVEVPLDRVRVHGTAPARALDRRRPTSTGATRARRPPSAST